MMFTEFVLNYNFLHNINYFSMYCKFTTVSASIINYCFYLICDLSCIANCIHLLCI